MDTRRADLKIVWNGADVPTEAQRYVTSFSYTDPASGEADSISMSIHDRDRRWTGPWMPEKGDTLSAEIQVRDWDSPGDDRRFYCGFFILDQFSFSGWPVTGDISAISVPVDDAFRETKRSKVWEKVTIEEIAKEAASKAGVELVWDVEETFQIDSLEQNEETDCEFLQKLCEEYGYAMKVYAWKIVIFDRAAYKKRKAVLTLTKSDLKSFRWQTDMVGSYTGGEFAYTDPRTEEEISVKAGKGPQILKVSGKADNQEDAKRKLKAAIEKENHGKTNMSAEIRGRPGLTASQCVEVKGLHRLDGKYYIDSITSSVGGGYSMSLGLSKVEE